MQCWDNHENPVYWVLRSQPPIEMSPELLYDFQRQRVVGSERDLTPIDFTSVRNQQLCINSDGMFIMWFRASDRTHLVCFPSREVGFTMTPRWISFYMVKGRSFMKHLVLSEPPEVPENLTKPRHYMDAKKAVMFMMSTCLPLDMKELVVRQLLDGDDIENTC